VKDRLALDHLVYGVPNLERAIGDFEERLGVAPVFGGRHEGLGTHNAILPLANETYLELIASDPDGPVPNQPRPFGLDTLHRSRLVTWAARSRSIETDVECARERGFDPGLVLPVSRKDPNGETLHWKLTLRREPFGDGLVPFLIDWGDSRHPAAATTTPTGNKRGVDEDDRPLPRCRLSGFSALHPDPESVQAALVALGVELDVRSGNDAQLNACLIGPAGSLELGEAN